MFKHFIKILFVIIISLAMSSWSLAFAQIEAYRNRPDALWTTILGNITQIDSQNNILTVHGLEIDLQFAEIETWRELSERNLISVKGYLVTSADPMYLVAEEVQLKSTNVFFFNIPAQSNDDDDDDYIEVDTDDDDGVDTDDDDGVDTDDDDGNTSTPATATSSTQESETTNHSDVENSPNTTPNDVNTVPDNTPEPTIPQAPSTPAPVPSQPNPPVTVSPEDNDDGVDTDDDD